MDNSKINYDSSFTNLNIPNTINVIEDIKEININDIQLINAKLINNNIENNKNLNNNHLGRKRKNSKEKRFHTKFSDDNKTSKIKNIIIKAAMTHINNQLKEDYNDKLEVMQLLRLNHNKNNTVKYNIEFLNKSLKEIFSDKINKKYQNYHEDHNQNLIKKLLKENDKDKREKYTNIFNLTFLDCLQYYITKTQDENKKFLVGMETLDDIKIKDDEKYEKELKDYISGFEKIINEKKGRKRRKNEN